MRANPRGTLYGVRPRGSAGPDPRGFPSETLHVRVNRVRRPRGNIIMMLTGHRWKKIEKQSSYDAFELAAFELARVPRHSLSWSRPQDPP
jgi:hypothetical protein